ncbi:MAG: SRPBCC domain-containing protein [Acidobacteria bacterium]|nr:SRPBCC domain-containing protein [Acidobacteriota bacterium]
MRGRFYFVTVGFLLLSYAHCAASSNRQLRIARTFTASAEAAFGAWTNTAAIKQWFIYGAAVHWISDPLVEVKAAGMFRWKLASDGNDVEVFSFHGTYRVFQPSLWLVFTWEWDSLPIPEVELHGSTLVTIRFLSRGANTTLVLTQTGFQTEAARRAHERGWNRCMDGIAKVLAEQQR